MNIKIQQRDIKDEATKAANDSDAVTFENGNPGAITGSMVPNASSGDFQGLIGTINGRNSRYYSRYKLRTSHCKGQVLDDYEDNIADTIKYIYFKCERTGL